MKLIDGDRIITAQLYDDQHEEFTEKKMSIIDYVNAYTDEGVAEADVVEQTEWIPVSERLPEADELVLATWKRNGKGKAYVSKFWHEMDGCFFDYESTPYGTDEVLAWMPLPKPYKAESEDK